MHILGLPRYLQGQLSVEIWMLPQGLPALMAWIVLPWKVVPEFHFLVWWLWSVNLLTFTPLVTGDQVSKKGGMTGGFYDYRRSKLKFMNTIRQNTRSINSKQEELENVRFKLQDILFKQHILLGGFGWINSQSIIF
jgi:hypothetical protein